MWMHFATLVKHPKKVLQSVSACREGYAELARGCAVLGPIPCPVAGCVGTLGGSCPHPSDVPATGCFHGRDPQAPP